MTYRRGWNELEPWWRKPDGAANLTDPGFLVKSPRFSKTHRGPRAFGSNGWPQGAQPVSVQWWNPRRKESQFSSARICRNSWRAPEPPARRFGEDSDREASGP